MRSVGASHVIISPPAIELLLKCPENRCAFTVEMNIFYRSRALEHKTNAHDFYTFCGLGAFISKLAINAIFNFTIGAFARYLCPVGEINAKAGKVCFLARNHLPGV